MCGKMWTISTITDKIRPIYTQTKAAHKNNTPGPTACRGFVKGIDIKGRDEVL